MKTCTAFARLSTGLVWNSNHICPFIPVQTNPHPASGRQDTATLRPVPQRDIGVTGQFIDLTETRTRHTETYTPDRSHGPVQATTEIAPEITALCHGTLL